MWRHGRDQADFSEEIRAHLEMETDRLRGEGLSETEAYAQARREFGNVMRVEERFYESNRLFLAAENVLRDLRYIVRGLRKSPSLHRTCDYRPRRRHWHECRHVQPH